MPATGPRTPSWDRLYQTAEAQEGYVTTAQAHEAGYSNPLISHHVRHGRLERVLRGVYRLHHFPPGEHEDLVVAWLWSGKEGVFSHETALAIRELSDALPATKHMIVPASWSARRLRIPEGIQLHYADLPHRDTCWVGAVRVTNPVRTIRDCIEDDVGTGLVRQAIEESEHRGLLSPREATKLRRAKKLT